MDDVLTDRVVELLMEDGLESVLTDLASAGGGACVDEAGGV